MLFILSFIVFGLFYEYAACIFSGLFGIRLLHIWNKERLKIYWNIESITISLIVGMYLVTCIYGVDSGTSLIGFFKMLSVVFFLFYAMQISKEDREKLLDTLPILGCVFTILGLLGYVIEPLEKYFILIGRIGGTFQYPNVYALFCLLGLIRILGNEKKRVDVYNVAQILLLILGIFLSGSRTVFLIFLFTCLVWCIREKKYRVPLIAGISCLLIAGIIYANVTGDFQNIARFLTTSFTASEFLGRILYMKDGLRLLLEHPFGLGYLGYFFMEPAIQTGVYSIRFIHNDFLQMALDVGIVPCVLFIIIIIKNIRDKNNAFKNRLSLLVIALHCLVDFDLEFTGIWFVIILLLNWEYGKEVSIKKKEWALKGILLALSVIGIYMGISMVPKQLGYTELTLKLLPIDTEAKKECITVETDMQKAVSYAQEIVSQNAYIPAAYDILALAEYQKGDFAAMAEYKMKSLKLQKYDISAYERYLILLNRIMEEAEEKQNFELEERVMKQVILVERLLEETQENTDAIAYKINDKPNFELSESMKQYVNQIKREMKK